MKFSRYFTFITSSAEGWRTNCWSFPSKQQLRWLAQEHDEAIRPSKSRQLISSGIVNLFLSSWRRLIERTFNINITSRKNCVTVKCAPRDKTICWTPRVIIHDLDARVRYRFHYNDQRSAMLPPPRISTQLPNEIRRRKNSDYRANLRLHLDSELSHLTFTWTIKYLVSYQLWKSRVRIERRASYAPTRKGFNENKAGGEKSRKKVSIVIRFS